MPDSVALVDEDADPPPVTVTLAALTVGTVGAVAVVLPDALPLDALDALAVALAPAALTEPEGAIVDVVALAFASVLADVPAAALADVFASGTVAVRSPPALAAPLAPTDMEPGALLAAAFVIALVEAPPEAEAARAIPAKMRVPRSPSDPARATRRCSHFLVIEASFRGQFAAGKTPPLNPNAQIATNRMSLA